MTKQRCAWSHQESNTLEPIHCAERLYHVLPEHKGKLHQHVTFIEAHGRKVDYFCLLSAFLVLLCLVLHLYSAAHAFLFTIWLLLFLFPVLDFSEQVWGMRQGIRITRGLALLMMLALVWIYR